ncbi:hypothetical protein [Sinorhizobium americanum]|uniref:Uncharacterized protein n=1 Tax=Sinorhizobium americanum TaxID=194963 RepID=A0A1L3LLM2_9HYPH|nr:hypothetical protein [Sinorhizobium americanum]APG84450.1 hypothetical protein SAMCCGM7_Ch1698 [Sinorhizobium americanum CCGM7]APG91002.1 hypothetical protein SAMCFNEI73_Ch1708 [Sinorhizobium americanum]OAP43605.1 hypothetical protein ATC00_01745 [Sinorhizobium americanum]TCN30221.1 hypothetical protein EV184_10892 [Sinorhizobium americanum]
MAIKNTNSEAEQKKPKDVQPPVERQKHVDENSIAPPLVQPPGAKDTSEKPKVNPVTGGAV